MQALYSPPAPRPIHRWIFQIARPFPFDPGPDPSNGQTDDLNVELPVNERQVKIVSARHAKLQPNNHMFLFTRTADTCVIGARITDPAHPPVAGGMHLVNRK